VLDFFKELTGDPVHLRRFATEELNRFHQAEAWHAYAKLPSLGMQFYMDSPSMTDYGRALPWLDCQRMTFRKMALDAGQIFEAGGIDEYWASLPPMDVYRTNWGYLLTGHDIPISRHDDETGWKHFDIEGDEGEIEGTADTLLEEAVANRKWTIPKRAMVELSFGPFLTLELSEVGSDVFIVCRTKEGRFQITFVEPHTHRCTFVPAWGAAALHDQRLWRIAAGVKLLLSAIIRDFWVVEERETVFSSRSYSAPKRKAEMSDAEPRIVYLPRVRYLHRPDIQHCAAELAHQERRAHFVAAHKRRAENPSEHQVLLAQRYGFVLPPDGHFKIPHLWPGQNPPGDSWRITY
jgi:hypothetical protein